MSYAVIDCPQRSDAWRLARVGRVTSSRSDAVSDFLKSGVESAKRRDYKFQLVCETLTGRPQDSEYVNDDMRRGIELEPEAIMRYELHANQIVQTVGFLAHADVMAGASLDGYVGAFDGVIEAKAPRPANHLKYLRAGAVPAEHRAQLVHALWICGAAWADFISYCPAFPSPLDLFVVRLARDEREIRAHADAVRAFLAEVQTELDAVRTLAHLSGQLAASVTA